MTSSRSWRARWPGSPRTRPALPDWPTPPVAGTGYAGSGASRWEVPPRRWSSPSAPVVVSGLGGDDRATDPVDDPAPEGWQTISQADVRVSVPADWTSGRLPGRPEPVRAPRG